MIRATPERVFAFHELPDALQRLTPPWERGHIVALPRSLHVGEQTVVDISVLGPSGPFHRWEHRHIVAPHALGATLHDAIDYELPLGFLGRLLVPVVATPRLLRLFEYRHAVTREWCERPG